MNVIWLPGALQDLTLIIAGRRRYSEDAAEKLLAAIEAHVASLEQYPRLGRVIAEFGNDRLRELPESGYRVWYEIYVDRIEVFAIVHSRQNFGSATE